VSAAERHGVRHRAGRRRKLVRSRHVRALPADILEGNWPKGFSEVSHRKESAVSKKFFTPDSIGLSDGGPFPWHALWSDFADDLNMTWPPKVIRAHDRFRNEQCPYCEMIVLHGALLKVSGLASMLVRSAWFSNPVRAVAGDARYRGNFGVIAGWGRFYAGGAGQPRPRRQRFGCPDAPREHDWPSFHNCRWKYGGYRLISRDPGRVREVRASGGRSRSMCRALIGRGVYRLGRFAIRSRHGAGKEPRGLIPLVMICEPGPAAKVRCW